MAISASALTAERLRLDVIANNLANVSTPGFRAELHAFRAVPVQGSGASTRVYALETTPGYDASPGVVANTGRPLDVAMRGNAWLAVQGLDGTEAYTRGGAFEVSASVAVLADNAAFVIEIAGQHEIPLISSSLGMYEICGRLFQWGLPSLETNIKSLLDD